MEIRCSYSRYKIVFFLLTAQYVNYSKYMGKYTEMSCVHHDSVCGINGNADSEPRDESHWTRNICTAEIMRYVSLNNLNERIRIVLTKS